LILILIILLVNYLHKTQFSNLKTSKFDIDFYIFIVNY